MDLSHSFTVPTSVEATWDHFTDLASVAQCFPGAQVTSIDGDSFAGSVKVKLGPIALQYNGAGTFIDKDAAAHRMVIEAKGKDKRGNGTAGATVTLTMASVASGETEVKVLTDLAITGKPAQFGRGVMQDVSDKLLGQFVSCLAQQLAADAPAPAAPADGAPVASADAGAATDPTDAPAAVPEAADAAESAAAPATEAPSTPRPASPPPPQRDEALNLGATVLPVLAKAYWKQGVGVLAVIGLVIWWLSRR